MKKIAFTTLALAFAFSSQHISYADDGPTELQIREGYANFQAEYNALEERTKAKIPAEERKNRCNFIKYITLGKFKIVKQTITNEIAELTIEPDYVATENYDDILKKENCVRNKYARAGDKKLFGEIVKGQPIGGTWSADYFQPHFLKKNGKWISG